MSDNFVEIDYELDASQAKSELDKIRKALAGVNADFLSQINTSRAGVEKLTSTLEKMVKTYKKVGGMNLARAEQRRDSMLGSNYQTIGQGSTTAQAAANQLNRAAGQAIISDLTNSAKAVQARISDTIVKSAVSMMRTTEAAIEARIRTARFTTNQGIANGNERLLNARSTLADQRRQDQIYSAENGRASLASRNRMESINHNGGADLMGIQGRVMLNYMAVGGIFNSAKAMTAGVIELDKELHQFQAISTATNREMTTFKKNLLEISATVPFTALEMTKAATMLAQAGLSTGEVTQSLGAVTMFATATGSDLAQAVDVVTSSLTAFNLETGRTGDVANIYTAALNLSKLSVDKLITAMNYIGPTAEAMGITLEETTAVLGALSQSGVRASTMGTGFRALLTDLQSPSKKLVATLSAAGLSIEDINVKTKGFLPVIETLKDAGFGAAEAYEALEVRAAASYIALANNTELAYDMQRSFTLSAAAVEANSVQMQSLSNTAKNFGGVVSAAAYIGFEPLIDLLQKVMAGATGALTVLTEYPALLTAIGAAAAGLGALTALSLGGAMVKSLGMMIPIFATFSAGSTAAGAAAATAGVGVGFLGKALAGLMAIARAHWIGLLISGVVMAGAAFFAWQGRADDLTESIDQLKGRVNELKGAADTAAGKITSIDSAIQGLIDRRAELDGNELMRGAKIDELRNQFQELGLSIKDDTASVADLIRELHDLKQTSSQVRRDELGEALSASKLQMRALQEQQKGLTDPESAGVKELKYLMATEVVGNDGAITQSQIPYLLSEIEKRYGAGVGEAARIGMGDLSSVQDDPLRAKSITSNINDQINQMRLHPDDQTETRVAFLEELREVLKPLVANVTAIGALRADMTVTERQQASSAIQASNAYNSLGIRQDNIKTGFNERRLEIHTSDLTNEKKIEALDELNRWLERVTDTTVGAFKREFADESVQDPKLSGVDPSVIANQMQTELGKLTLSINAEKMKASAELAKSTGKELKRAQSDQSKQLSQWQRQISGAKNNESFEAAKDGYDGFLEASRDQIAAYYDKLIALVGDRDPDETERLQTERSDYLERLTGEAEEQQRANTLKEQDLLKESLNRQRAAIEDVSKGLRKQIDMAMEELKRTPPSAAMNALVEKIKQLTGQLAGELGKIGNIDTQLTSVGLGEPITTAVAGSARSAMQAFIDAGLSKVGAAAVAANISTESGFNPNARGDWDSDTKKHTAFGAGQWRGSRWTEMQQFATEQGASAWDINTQYQFILKELARDYPELFNRLKSGDEDVQTLTRDFMKEFERPNADPKLNHIDKRLREGQAFNSMDLDSASAEIEQITTATEEAIKENNVEAVQAISDATIKNLKARLGNLKTQVRLNDDAGSLQDIQGQIQKAHAGIVEAELAKFDAENATLKTDNNAAFQAQRELLQEKLRENLNSDLLKVMEEFYKAAEEELNRPIDAAKATLDAAQQPDMANKYTEMDLQKMQQAVTNAEREASINRVLLIEQQIADVRARAAEAEATYGPDSSEALMWRSQENELIARNNDLKVANNALDVAKAQNAPTVLSGIQSANQAWAQQNGLLDQAGNMVPIAKQVEQTWGQVLGGLQSGFSTFFQTIFSGTATAGEAFKQLGLSVLQMFTEIIAKALANQILMSLFGIGGTTGGAAAPAGGGFMDLIGSFLGIGSAVGGAVRAATGRKVNAPFRDSKLYNLMDGEYVLRQSAVQAIGVDKLDTLNNLGNRQVSEGALGGKVASNDNAQQSGVVNVWVVSPDQVPAAGPNDIIATVAQNIQNRGTIKQLIQQVQMGAV